MAQSIQDLALDCRRALQRVSRKSQQSQLLPHLPMSQGHRIHSSDTMCLTGSVWDVSHQLGTLCHAQGRRPESER